MALMEFDSLEDIKEEIKAFAVSVNNMNSLYLLIETELKDIANVAVSEQKSVTTNRAWNPLTETTQKVTGKPARPALYSRTLGGFIDVRMNPGANDTATIAYNLPYGEVHQFGNPNNTMFGHVAPIPARAFMPFKKDGTFTQAFQDRLEDIVSDWIDSEMIKNKQNSSSEE